MLITNYATLSPSPSFKHAAHPFYAPFFSTLYGFLTVIFEYNSCVTSRSKSGYNACKLFFFFFFFRRYFEEETGNVMSNFELIYYVRNVMTRLSAASNEDRIWLLTNKCYSSILINWGNFIRDFIFYYFDGLMTKTLFCFSNKYVLNPHLIPKISKRTQYIHFYLITAW